MGLIRQHNRSDEVLSAREVRLFVEVSDGIITKLVATGPVDAIIGIDLFINDSRPVELMGVRHAPGVELLRAEPESVGRTSYTTLLRMAKSVSGRSTVNTQSESLNGD